MTDKKLRGSSWPAIELVFRRNNMAEIVDKYNKRSSREYYVNRVEFADLKYKGNVHANGLSFVHKLILEPDASQDKWGIWCDESGCNPGDSDEGWFLSLQGGGRDIGVGEYFGENTIFQGREDEIFDFFFGNHKSSVEQSRWFGIGNKDTVRSLLSLPTCVSSVFSLMNINPYYVSWRFAERRFEELRSLPVSRFPKFESLDDAQSLAKSICPIEWVRRNPGKFDPKMTPIVSLCCEFYNKSQPLIRQVYEQVIEYTLVDWAEATGAGGDMTVCIRYDDPVYLKAILPLLDPTSRFPCKADDRPGLVNALPLLKGRSHRASYYIIKSFWDAGFVTDSHAIIDNNTLVLGLKLPLSRKKLYPVISNLACDVRNLEERVLSRSNLPGDTVFEDEGPHVADIVYVIQPLIGKRRVGAVSRLIRTAEDAPEDVNKMPHWVEIAEGENTSIDSVLGDLFEEKSVVKLLDHYEDILRFGCEPMGSENGKSLDGFERVL